MRLNWRSLGRSLQGGLDWTAGLGVLAAIALFAGCGNTSGRAGGWLTAAIREATDSGGRESTYLGDGDFAVGADPGAGVSIAFQLDSRGIGASAGQTIGLFWPGHGRPTAGRYELASLRTVDGRLEGFTAFYHRVAGGRGESFTALSGYVDVQRSSEDQVDGAFQVTGILYCLANETPSQDDWCTAPTTITPGAPQVEVTGSFKAVAYRPGPQSFTRP